MAEGMVYGGPTRKATKILRTPCLVESLRWKGLHLVLVDVGESDATILGGFDTPEILKTPVITGRSGLR